MTEFFYSIKHIDANLLFISLIMYKYKHEHMCSLVLPSGSAYFISGRFSVCFSVMTAGHTKLHHIFTENLLPRSALLSEEVMKVYL